MKSSAEMAEAVCRIGEERLQRQKRRKKKNAVLFGVGATILLFAAAVLIPQLTRRGPRIVDNSRYLSALPSESHDACYAFDPEDKRLMSGASDYILAARVTDIPGTVYTQYDTPYTVFTVQNLMNIKGSLTDAAEIELWEYGGVNRARTRVDYLIPLLEKDTTYVLYLTCAGNGILYLNKAYVLPQADGVSPEKILADPAHPAHDLLNDCIEAYETEDLTHAPQTKYVSRYDTSAAE